MNCNATFISVTLRNNENLVNPKLYIFEIEKDVLRYFNFAAGQNDAEDVSVPPNSAQSHLTSMQPPQPPMHSNTHVVNHSWDANEVNFLACYTKKQGHSISGKEFHVGKVGSLMSFKMPLFLHYRENVNIKLSNFFTVTLTSFEVEYL